MAEYIVAETTKRISQARELIVEYAESLGCSPCLANIEQELQGFPKPFVAPSGRLILAIDDGRPVGVVGLKKVAADICEMARLYVQPGARGRGHGRGLVRQCLAAGQDLGYRAMRLYTLPTMTTALAMYRKTGFGEIPPYTDQPIVGAVYLEYQLR